MAYQAHINHNEMNRTVELYIFEDLANGRRRVIKPMALTMKEIEEFDVFEPSLCLFYPISQSFLSAVAEALDREGIKTDSDAKIAGTLKATRAHLEDLQKLLKLRK